MKKLILIAAAALAVAACSGDEQDGWVPTPGAPLHIGDTVTTAVPTPHGVDCLLVESSPTTLDGRPVFKVAALPTSSTVTVNPSVLPRDVATVDRSCVTPYVRK